MTTNNDLAQAREWAEWIIQADNQVEVDPDLRGVANVIQSLPDEWFDADPAQIHAAVAEIVRLKQAIARLRDTYAAPDDPGDDYGRGAEAAYQIAARDLTRILEGKA